MPLFYSKTVLKIAFDNSMKEFLSARDAEYSSQEEREKAVEKAQGVFVSQIMETLTGTAPSDSFDKDEPLYEFVIKNTQIDQRKGLKDFHFSNNKREAVNQLASQTYNLVNDILKGDKEVVIPDIGSERKINEMLFEGMRNNDFSFSNSKELKAKLVNVNDLFKSYLDNAEDNNKKFYESLEQLQETCDKYDFVNSKEHRMFSSEEEYNKNIKELQAVRNLSSSIDLIKNSLKAEKKVDLTVKQNMKSFDTPENLADVMNEKNPEQFLMKFTNTKTPEEGLLRLNTLYIDAEVNNNRKNFNVTRRREFGSSDMIDDKRCIGREFGISNFDIFDKDKVKSATNFFYHTFKNKLEPGMSVYSLESNVEKDGDSLIEQVSFKKVLDSKALETYYQKNPPEEAMKTTKTLQDLAGGLKMENKGSQSDEYRDFKKAFDDLKAGKNSYPNEKLAQSVDKLMSYAHDYIMAKREQKGMTSTEVLDKATNEKMVGKIFWGYGKERYDFAVKVYEEMADIKRNLDNKLKPNKEFLREKASMSKEVGRKENEKLTSKTKTLNLNKEKGFAFE